MGGRCKHQFLISGFQIILQILENSYNQIFLIQILLIQQKILTLSHSPELSGYQLRLQDIGHKR